MFATLDAMRNKFGERELIELTDIETPYTDAINETRLNAAMQQANSEIEGYIGARYALPLQTVPPFLQSIACDMARYHASTGAMSENDPIKTRYDAALKTLKEISKGTIQIGGNPTGEASPVQSSNNAIVMTNQRKDFGGRNW
ncbi:gp436 family protein [Acinetobacter indicus]|uniref:gp436 family protein n=1 Tax=Acinetobacter indicus TaxID=756892 RepID=UPI0032B5C2C9